MTIHQQLGNRHGEAQALTNLGSLFAIQGKCPLATENYNHALTVFRELGDLHAQAQAEYNLGLALVDQGQSRQSAEHWRVALAIFEQLDAPEVEQVRRKLRRA